VKLPEQVKRLGVILALFLAVVVTRFFLLPDTWISAKPHQAAKVVREMGKPVHYAGMATCRECHEEEYNTKLGGYHRGIGCENCHGPSAAHVANKDDKAAMPVKHKDREFCLNCHGFVASRPNGFPQVDGEKHNARKKCVSCHDPHDPKPDEPPKECGGCHGRIAGLKALSTHAQVECRECHQVADQHMIEPRSALPTKPLTRDACARCHDTASTDPAAAKARVDFSKHGRTYVCWECHYAHLPEGPK
jgi:hypothetical protein